MSEDEFTKLFKHIQDFKNGVDDQFEEARNDSTDIKGAIGELSAQVRDYHNEMLISYHQFGKLKEAVMQIAKETGVKLRVEL